MPHLRLDILLFAGIACACTGEAADVACHYPEEARALVTDWTGDLAAGYRAKLHDSPNDPTTLFLVGVSLLSKDLTEAVRDFDLAVAKDSHYPWPYLALMDVYANLQPNLPHIQELYDKIKTRTDVQLVTLDVDENPGMADLFVKRWNYTTVLIAEGYFAQIQPALSVPRTWIAGKTGAVHLEKINSNEANGSPAFVQEVLDQLERQ
jgi:hypothetical protein